MNKKIFSASIFVVLIIYSGHAQKKEPAISPVVFRNLIGCWQGILNYSGTMIRKPFTTTSELIVKQIRKSDKFQFINAYTKNAAENQYDTIVISANGKKLNNATIKSKRNATDGNVEIIAEAAGFDHDTNKKAIVRQIYTIGKQRYNYKTMVQPEGQDDWLDRQDFDYVRKPCTSENK